MKAIFGAGAVLAMTLAWAGDGDLVSSEGVVPTSQIKAELKASAASELGAVAARMVAKAPAESRVLLTRRVVTTAFELRPMAAVQVVASVAQAVPEAAAAAAGAVAASKPDSAVAVTREAVQRAPAQVRAIVAAVSKEAATKYKGIGLAAVEALPGATADILAGLAEGVPALQPLFDRVKANAANDGRPLTVAQAVTEVDQWLAAMARTKTGVKMPPGSTPEQVTQAQALAAASGGTSGTSAKAGTASSWLWAPPGPPTPGPIYTPPCGGPAEKPANVGTPGPRQYSGP